MHTAEFCSNDMTPGNHFSALEKGEMWTLELNRMKSRCKPLHLEWMSNEVLLYSTGNYIQSPVTEHDGKECVYKRIYMYVYV